MALPRTAADLRRVVDFSHGVLGLDDYGAVRDRMLRPLADVVGSDRAALTHLDLATHREVAVFWPAPPAAELLAAYRDVAPGHPLRRVLHPRRHPGGHREPVRISDLMGRLEWQRTAVHQRALRGTTDQLVVPLDHRGGGLRAVTLSRQGGVFTDRQRDLLHGVSLYLTAALRGTPPRDRRALQIFPHARAVPLAAAPGLAVLDGPAAPAGPVPSSGQVSDRERQVLALVADGLTDAQVARRLGVRTSTVSKHLQRVYARLGVPNRAAAAALWLRHRDLPDARG